MTKHLFLSIPFALGLALASACGGNAVADETNCVAYCEDPSANSGKESLCKDFCTDRSTSTEGKTDACKDFCAAQSKCSTPTNCEDICNKTDTVSRGGQEVLTACLEKLGCDSTNTSAIGICLLGGLDDLPLSDTANTFCDTTAPALREACAVTQTPILPCESGVALFSDKFLTDLNECAKKTDCKEAQICLGAAALANTPLETLNDPSIAELLKPLLGILGGVTPPPPPEPVGMGGAAN